MTTEPKLLTEAEWLAWMQKPQSTEKALTDLRERGLIAEEPVDPLLVEARQIIADTCDTHESKGQWLDGVWDDEQEMAIALAALRRGMELAPRKELTREMVLKAHWHATGAETVEANLIDRLHAALTEALQ